MSKQLTNKILMVRPANFGFNQQTAASNSFQQQDGDSINTNTLAIAEFDRMVNQLQVNGIQVIVIQDLDHIKLPDAVFPNNWFSTHEAGVIYTYPMYAPIRRQERREDILSILEKEFHFSKRYSLEILEKDHQFLEGTGSMVLDRVHKIAYACLSPRTDIRALDTFAMLSHYKIVHFIAKDRSGAPIYHTNVLMAMGQDFVICCLEAVQVEHREILRKSFEETHKTLIEINYQQMEQFAGNMLELINKDHERILVMSESAFQSLNNTQIEALKSRTKLLPISIPTIEKVGGGSTRCMMAEIY
ncbi:MAG: amidinotransferase [Saprospiraceae bacterium]|nr:amidinotransferase [Saprospiraceae bacterium]